MRTWLIATAVLMACEGPRGPAGDQGPRGEPGENGISVAESVLCTKAAAGLVFTYEAVIFSDGGVLVSCRAADGQFEIGNTSYHRAEQSGSDSRSCMVLRDAEQDGGFGFWRFELDADGYFVSYVDPDSADDGQTFAFDGPSAEDGGCNIVD